MYDANEIYCSNYPIFDVLKNKNSKAKFFANILSKR